MNASHFWVALDHWGFSVAWVLLTVLWQSSILFVAIMLLARLLRRRRATVRHGLWVAALVAAPLLPLLTLAASHLGAPQAPVSVLPAYGGPVDVPPLLVAPLPPEPPRAEPAPAEETSEPQPPAPRFSLWNYPWALFGGAYGAGVLVFLAWIVLGRIRIRQWLLEAAPVADERVCTAFKEAREKLGLRRGFFVGQSTQVAAPLTAGLLRAVVLLPEGLSDTLGDAELRAVALHETAHVARRDPLVLSVIPLVRAFLFFHPLVWLACRQVSVLAEQAADDTVLDATGEPLAYAKMLARLAEELHRRSVTTELAAGIVLSKSAFLRRVEAILSDRRDSLRNLSRRALALTILAALLSLFLAAALPLGEKQSAPTEEEKASAPSRSPSWYAIRGEVSNLTRDYSEENLAELGASKSWEEFGEVLSRIWPRRRPAPNVVVKLRGKSLTREAVSDAEGKFAFAGLFRGDYELSAEMPAPPSWSGVKRLATATERVAAAGWDTGNTDRYVNLDLRTDRVTVSGRITDGHGQAIAGAKVTATEVITNPEYPFEPRTYSTVSQADGSYELQGIEPTGLGEAQAYLRTGDPWRLHCFDMRVVADGFVQRKANEPRVPMLTEEVVGPARAVLKAMSQVSRRVEGYELREKEGLAFPSSHGDTIAGIDIALEPAEVALERVFETIRQRQARVKTISYTWTSKWVIPKGSMMVADPATGLPVRSDLPAEDTEIERTQTLVIDGRYVRYDDEGLVWFEGRGTGEFVQERDTVVLGADGVERQLFRFDDGSTGGLLGPLRYIPAGVEYQAVLQAYRLTDSVLGKVSPREVRFAGRAELRGHPCILVEKREEVFQPSMTKRWWLAEDMGYAVLRWEEKRDSGEHLVQLDMNYTPDQQVGWQLTSWSLTTWGGAHGEPLTRTNVATEVHINEPVAAATFQITFPPGTRVSDGLRGGQYVVGSQPVTYPAGAPEGEMSFEERVLRVKLRWRVPFFNFTDAPLEEVLKFIRAVAGIDVVLAPQVQEERDRLKVTMLEQDTSTEEALNYITTALNLEWSVRDGSVHVSPKTKLTAAAAIGEPAPELVLAEGAGVTLAQFKGKPVVVAFVSIYARPCVKVLDDLKALQAEKGADKLAVLAVHDRTATPEEIEQFRKDHGITFAILRVPAAPRDGWDSATFQAYKVTALPTVVWVDAEGKVESVGANVP